MTTSVFVLAMTMTMPRNATIAAEPELTTEASTDAVRVAESFTLDITVHADQGSKVTFPDGQSTLGAFDIRDTQDRFDVPAEGNASLRTWTRKLTLETIETGDLLVPPINLQFRSPSVEGRQSVVQQLTTPSMPIRVVSVLDERSDPTKFRDIESVVDAPIPESSTSSMPWAVGGAGLTALALFLGVVVTVRRRRQCTTPLKWAMEQFNCLDPEVEASTPQLSQIVREFLVMHFEMPATGSTPQEILNQLQAQMKLETTTVERLKCLFEIADKAKFAGLCLSPEGLASAIKDSRELVQRISEVHANTTGKS